MDEEDRKFDPSKFSVSYNSQNQNFQKLLYVVLKNPHIRDSRSVRNFEETNEQGIPERPFLAWNLTPLGRALRKAIGIATPILEKVKDKNSDLDKEIEIFWFSKFGKGKSMLTSFAFLLYRNVTNLLACHAGPGISLERAPGAGYIAPVAPTAPTKGINNGVPPTHMAPAAAAAAPHRVSLPPPVPHHRVTGRPSGGAGNETEGRDGIRYIDPSMPLHSVVVYSDPEVDGKQYVAMLIPNMGGNTERNIQTTLSDDGRTFSVTFVLGGDFNKPHKLQRSKAFEQRMIEMVGPPYNSEVHQLLFGSLTNHARTVLDGMTRFGIEYKYPLPFPCNKRFSTIWTTCDGTNTLKVVLTSHTATSAKHMINRKRNDENFTLDETDSDVEDLPFAKRSKFA